MSEAKKENKTQIANSTTDPGDSLPTICGKKYMVKTGNPGINDFLREFAKVNTNTETTTKTAPAKKI